MCRDWNRKEAGYHWYAKLAFLHFLDTIREAEDQILLQNQKKSAVIVSAVEYIRNHFSENLNRDLLAERFFLSPPYFGVLFKQYTGYSISQFITEIRLERAKLLLKNTPLPIRNIAEQVGYADSFYFTRLFTREVGISPREFRKI